MERVIRVKSEKMIQNFLDKKVYSKQVCNHKRERNTNEK